jgi:hypothetical protein
MRIFNKLFTVFKRSHKSAGINLDPRLNTAALIAHRRAAMVSKQYKQSRSSKAWAKKLLNVWHNTLILMRPSRSLAIFSGCLFLIGLVVATVLYGVVTTKPADTAPKETEVHGEPLILRFSTELSTFKQTNH